jgi:hypothetical protein
MVEGLKFAHHSLHSAQLTIGEPSSGCLQRQYTFFPAAFVLAGLVEPFLCTFVPITFLFSFPVWSWSLIASTFRERPCLGRGSTAWSADIFIEFDSDLVLERVDIVDTP